MYQSVQEERRADLLLLHPKSCKEVDMTCLPMYVDSGIQVSRKGLLPVTTKAENSHHPELFKHGKSEQERAIFSSISKEHQRRQRRYFHQHNQQYPCLKAHHL